MRPEFQQHNLFVKSVDSFLTQDPNLSYLTSLKYVMEPDLLEEIPLQTPGVYILTGARQVGKSTLLKLLIKRLLLNKICSSDQILYLPCDIIIGFHELINEIDQFLSQRQLDKPFFLFIDEVTYVKGWDRAIKHFADLGLFRLGSVLITGSDSTILLEGMKRFPGRRGTAPNTDFHYYPLSFSDYVALIESKLAEQIKSAKDIGPSFIQSPSSETLMELSSNCPKSSIELLNSLFNQYIVTGGFLTAINEFAAQKSIGKYVYNTYIQWIIGDFLKRNKKENYLREIIFALGDRLGKQLSFNNITDATDIQSHSTTQEYLEVLMNMDVLFVLEALREDKLRAAPKKLKKIHFSDPFIAYALICWSRGIHDFWDFVQNHILQDSQIKAEIIEGTIASLFRRKHKTFFIKAENEVDLALIMGNSFIPIEIKYSPNLKQSDLKQIFKYPKGIIGYNGLQTGQFQHLQVLPLPLLALLA